MAQQHLLQFWSLTQMCFRPAAFRPLRFLRRQSQPPSSLQAPTKYVMLDRQQLIPSQAFPPSLRASSLVLLLSWKENYMLLAVSHLVLFPSAVVGLGLLLIPSLLAILMLISSQ